MTARDVFQVFLGGIRTRDVDYKTLEDGRHWLDITGDVALVVRPAGEGLAETVAGLRKLAEAASAMADALEATS